MLVIEAKTVKTKDGKEFIAYDLKHARTNITIKTIFLSFQETQLLEELKKLK